MRFFDNRSEIHPFISRGFRANHGVSLKLQVLSFSHPMGPEFEENHCLTSNLQ